MRVGGLHALEAVGQAHPERRQAIADVVCACLRMPARDDGPVRLAAQRILTAHLLPAAPGFWAGLNLDLTGAVLTDLDLTGCRVDGELRLDRAVFVGAAKLRGLVVGGRMGLRAAVFRDHAWLERATFNGVVDAEAVTFQGDAWFGEATFTSPASFVGATFVGHAWFGGCSLRASVDFGEALFRRSAGFRGANAPKVGLAGTTFLGPARVSRRGDGWNLTSPGWMVVVDPDNESVGQLLWVGHTERAWRSADEEKTPV
jgi:uncharacterized protein YjbI with pentapeptide repeats